MKGVVPQLQALCSIFIFKNRENDSSFIHNDKAVNTILVNLSKQSDPDQTLQFFSTTLPKFIQSLDFSNTKLNNNGLALLKNLADLRHLSLSNCKYFDIQGLKYTEELRLHSLDISKCSQLPSASIKTLLSHLPRLRKLNAADTHFNDDCVQSVTNMARLNHVNFSRTKITDQAVTLLTGNISKLSRLSTVIATGTSLTNDCVSHWSDRFHSFENSVVSTRVIFELILFKFTLGHPKPLINDYHIDLPSLTVLNLANTRVDELGLYQLERLLRDSKTVLNVHSIGAKLDISRSTESKMHRKPSSTNWNEAVKTFLLNQRDPLGSPKSKTNTHLASCFDDMWEGSTSPSDALQLMSDPMCYSGSALVDYKSPSLHVSWDPDFSFVKRRIIARSPNKAKPPMSIALPVRIYDDTAKKIDFDCTHANTQNDTLTRPAEDQATKSIAEHRPAETMKENTENNSNNADEAKINKKKRRRQKEKERKKKKRKLAHDQTAVNTKNNIDSSALDVTVR